MQSLLIHCYFFIDQQTIATLSTIYIIRVGLKPREFLSSPPPRLPILSTPSTNLRIKRSCNLSVDTYRKPAFGNTFYTTKKVKSDLRKSIVRYCYAHLFNSVVQIAYPACTRAFCDLACIYHPFSFK